ncbi:hypothetical protein SKAU_G00164110 [Synaphobranchus kaupii]|uniref:Uncharacterized protein n=1 Tax=Synaphobranchus kaupii TaxID=118154 RepID=A0A9Q1FJA0_SYNKA|nr:hypothetical protein SKAU_G00164110 [Synaphobranchus kaupii]
MRPIESGEQRETETVLGLGAASHSTESHSTEPHLGILPGEARLGIRRLRAAGSSVLQKSLHESDQGGDGHSTVRQPGGDLSQCITSSARGVLRDVSALPASARLYRRRGTSYCSGRRGDRPAKAMRRAVEKPPLVPASRHRSSRLPVSPAVWLSVLRVSSPGRRRGTSKKERFHCAERRAALEWSRRLKCNLIDLTGKEKVPVFICPGSRCAYVRGYALHSPSAFLGTVARPYGNGLSSAGAPSREGRPHLQQMTRERRR